MRCNIEYQNDLSEIMPKHMSHSVQPNLTSYLAGLKVVEIMQQEDIPLIEYSTCINKYIGVMNRAWGSDKISVSINFNDISWWNATSCGKIYIDMHRMALIHTHEFFRSVESF